MSGTTLADTLIVCQYCPPPRYSTINSALDDAEEGDVIVVLSEEENPPGSGIIYTYSEHLEIDKEITLTCDESHPDLGYPVVTDPLGDNDEVIHVDHAGVTISNLCIRGPDTNIVDITYPILELDNKVRIRITAGSCIIENCRIIQCFSGIVIDSSGDPSDMGNIISNCTIGDRYIYPNNTTEEYWENVFPNVHPGNGFGIVELNPDFSESPASYINVDSNQIVDCLIRSNRYYGIVLTNGSRARIAHNIIAWNGDTSFTFPPVSNQTKPEKTGGVLSLFTLAQINNTSNKNKLQNPLIMSNTIYGNKGYQVGIFTGATDPRKIYNSPILMSNSIGTQGDMGEMGNPSSIDTRYYLISCGPVPSVVPTATPTPTPTGTFFPPFTPTPDPPGSFTYEYFGSGPVMAWNNLYNETSHWCVYHPLQPDTLHHTPTPRPPPTPNPSPTPAPGYYKADAAAWAMMNKFQNPLLVGWREQSGSPDEFNWHLTDFASENPLPPPTGIPSATPAHSICFNTGGLQLNPGISQDDMLPDENRVDIGYHTRGGVPMVDNLQLDWIKDYTVIQITWDRPEYYYDGSLLEEWDVGGYTIYQGIIMGEPQQILPIGDPIHVLSMKTQYDLQSPETATWLGVLIYDVRGMSSDISWQEIPAVP